MVAEAESLAHPVYRQTELRRPAADHRSIIICFIWSSWVPDLTDHSFGGRPWCSRVGASGDWGLDAWVWFGRGHRSQNQWTIKQASPLKIKDGPLVYFDTPKKHQWSFVTMVLPLITYTYLAQENYSMLYIVVCMAQYGKALFALENH